MSVISSVFVAVSLDGFIARAGGELDWLEAANATVPEGEDCGYHAFFESVDALIMGRKTYEQVLSFSHWPYGTKPVIVLSRNKIDIPDELAATVSHSSDSPIILCKRFSESGAKRLYIDGGIPLFGDVRRDIFLKHVATKSYDFGFVQTTYEVVQRA